MLFLLCFIYILCLCIGTHCTNPAEPPMKSNLRITGWDGSPIPIGEVSRVCMSYNIRILYKYRFEFFHGFILYQLYESFSNIL